MNTKNLLLLGVLGVALFAIIRRTMAIFTDNEHELEGYDEENGVPLFI